MQRQCRSRVAIIPAGCGRAPIVGVDEPGRRVHVSPTGHRHWFPDGPVQQRGSVVRALADQVASQPWTETAGNALSGLGNALWGAISAPGNALSGQPVSLGDVLDTAGLISMVGAGMFAGSSPKSLASRAANLYDLPTASEVGDALGRSGARGLDLEGRSLVARHVVGRAEGRVGDQSLHPAVLDEIAERYAGGAFAPVPKSAIPRGAVGAVDVSRRGSLENPRIAADLLLEQAQRVMAHEAGHIID